jgi:uncharacterized protein (DUF433 family)
MSATDLTSHITRDDEGRAFVTQTGIKVIEVAADYLAYGSSVEEMALQMPHLTPAQIHAALAYYYDHQEEFDAELRASRVAADEAWKSAQESPVRRKLRAMGRLS